MNAKENAKTLKAHLHEVFIRDMIEIDPTTVEEIAQRSTATTLDTASMIDEAKAVIKKIKNNKAPGIPGIATDM